MNPLTWLKRFGKPRPLDSFLLDPDITREEKRKRIEDELRAVRVRLEALKADVDVRGRRG